MGFVLPKKVSRGGAADHS